MLKSRFILPVTILALVVPALAVAGPVPLKPGLWEIQMKIKKDGKEIDPQAQFEASLAKLPPDQRKQVEAMMAKSGVGGLTGKGMKVCYTKEMFAKPENFGKDPRGQCSTTLNTQTSTKISMSFKCKDGSAGTGEWNMPTSTTYNGHMKFTRKAGEVSEFAQTGSFLGADCGTVKPMTPPPSSEAGSE
jgi:hypothetical protein